MNLNKLRIISNKKINSNFYKILFGPVSNIYSFNFASILRNIFFTGIKGYGIVEVKFFGSDSEFGYIPGVKEDVFNLILNLKGVIFNVIRKKKIILNLNKKGPCKVKASDFYLNEFVSVLNPNHIIAHLSKSCYLNISIKIEKGLGYFFLNNDNYKKKKRDLDGILLDVNYCPVLDVHYNILKSNKFKNLDNIEFFIKTNGTISAKKILIKSVKILNSLTNLNFKNKLNKNIFIKISNLNFPQKYIFYLKKLKINFLGDLIILNEEKLLSISNLNFKFLKEVKNILLNYNLHLNTKNINWNFHLNKFLNNNLNNNEAFYKKR